jgi:integrase
LKRDFNFSGNTLTVRAACAKNSKTDQIPLRPELADALREYMADFPLTGRAFPKLRKEKGAPMLHADMAETGIPVYDEYGRKADFHSFRGTTAYLLSEAGIPLTTVQKIMRHSTPDLTAKHHVRLSVVDKAAAVGKLPDFHSAAELESDAMRATGTGRKPAENMVTLMATTRQDF